MAVGFPASQKILRLKYGAGAAEQEARRFSWARTRVSGARWRLGLGEAPRLLHNSGGKEGERVVHLFPIAL